MSREAPAKVFQAERRASAKALRQEHAQVFKEQHRNQCDWSRVRGKVIDEVS